MSWVDAVGSVIKAIAVPYGYTLAIWSAGMLAIGRYGHPRTFDVFTFVLGAVAGYLLLDLVALGSIRAGDTISSEIPSVAVLNILPIIPALLTAFLVREIPSSRLGFPAIGFASTVFYVLALSLLFWIWGQ